MHMSFERQLNGDSPLENRIMKPKNENFYPFFIEETVLKLTNRSSVLIQFKAINVELGPGNM